MTSAIVRAGLVRDALVAEGRAQTEAFRLAPTPRHALGTCGPELGDDQLR